MNWPVQMDISTHLMLLSLSVLYLFKKLRLMNAYGFLTTPKSASNFYSLLLQSVWPSCCDLFSHTTESTRLDLVGGSRRKFKLESTETLVIFHRRPDSPFYRWIIFVQARCFYTLILCLEI